MVECVVTCCPGFQHLVRHAINVHQRRTRNTVQGYGSKIEVYLSKYGSDKKETAFV